MTEAELQQKKQAWALGDHNNGLVTMGFNYKNAGYSEQDAIFDMQSFYESIDTPEKRDSHRKEVERAFHKAYESESGGDYAPAPQKKQAVVLDKQKLADFHKRLNGGDWLKKIEGWEKADHDCKTVDVLLSLYRNCATGYVAYYGNKQDTLWLDVATQFAKYDGGGKYCTLCTFAEKTKRTAENMENLAFFVIEIDTPHDMQKSGEDPTEEEKKVLKEKNKADTCRLIEALGLEPTTITFSGNKSWHVAFRLAKPVEKALVEKKRSLVSDALETLGADPAMASIVRSSRIPHVFPKCLPEEDKETRQHVVYWNPDAEVDYSTLVDKLVALAEEAGGVKLQQLPDLEKTCVFQYKKDEDENGNISYKTVWVEENWEPMVKELGIFRMTRDGNPFYIKMDKTGLYKEMELAEIGDYILNEVGKYKPVFKARLRVKRDLTQARWYTGINGSLTPIKDTKDCIIIPFKDRLVKVTKDAITVSKGYGGFSIPEKSPTLWLKFEPDHTQSEFEVFLRHACGELEDNPEWKKRFLAFKCLAGYLISGYKEHTNWMCVLSDESKNENEGGTGKSIFMTGVAKVREVEFRDERRATRDGQRFEDSDWNPNSRVLWRDEIPRQYDWSKDFATASTGKTIELKGKNQRIKIGFAEMQKLVYCTNFFPTGLGASFNRRRKMFELSNHYKAKVLTPETEFGHIMFTDWNEQEWCRFYTFMCECAQTYIQMGGLMESGSRYESEKTEEANVIQEFIGWFEDEIENSDEMTAGELLIPQKEVTIRYNNWYKNTMGHYPEALPRKQKCQWLRALAKNRGIEMEEVARRVDGKLLKMWRFSRSLENDPFFGDVQEEPKAEPPKEETEEQRKARLMAMIEEKKRKAMEEGI